MCTISSSICQVSSLVINKKNFFLVSLVKSRFFHIIFIIIVLITKGLGFPGLFKYDCEKSLYFFCFHVQLNVDGATCNIGICNKKSIMLHYFLLCVIKIAINDSKSVRLYNMKWRSDFELQIFYEPTFFSFLY